MGGKGGGKKNLRNRFMMPSKSNLSEILFVNSLKLRFVCAFMRQRARAQVTHTRRHSVAVIACIDLYFL